MFEICFLAGLLLVALVSLGSNEDNGDSKKGDSGAPLRTTRTEEPRSRRRNKAMAQGEKGNWPRTEGLSA